MKYLMKWQLVREGEVQIHELVQCYIMEIPAVCFESIRDQSGDQSGARSLVESRDSNNKQISWNWLCPLL